MPLPTQKKQKKRKTKCVPVILYLDSLKFLSATFTMEQRDESKGLVGLFKFWLKLGNKRDFNPRKKNYQEKKIVQLALLFLMKDAIRYYKIIKEYYTVFLTVLGQLTKIFDITNFTTKIINHK